MLILWPAAAKARNECDKCDCRGGRHSAPPFLAAHPLETKLINSLQTQEGLVKEAAEWVQGWMRTPEVAASVV